MNLVIHLCIFLFLVNRSQQTSIIFLYASNKHLENLNFKVIQEKDTIYNGIKKSKQQGISLLKDVQNLCTKNYKIQLREIKDMNKWKDSSCS